MNPLRIGIISYVNTLPLIRGLEQSPSPDYQLHYAPPSALADGLRNGELDAALIPAVEFFRGVGDGVVPGLCIASRGPVESIRFVSREPLDRLDRVLVDRGSRSSVAMLRLLLDRIHRINPDFHIYEPDPAHPLRGPDGEEAPAAMLIGDRAMELTSNGIPTDLDLGEWWQNTFHRPFVYALWVYRQRSADENLGEELTPLFHESYERGMRDLLPICEEVANDKGWSEERVYHYLTERISYRLDESAVAGLSSFHRLCVEDYLAPDRPGVEAALAYLLDSPQGLSRSPL